jgi:hypothetical protein
MQLKTLLFWDETYLLLRAIALQRTMPIPTLIRALLDVERARGDLCVQARDSLEQMIEVE